MITHFQELEQNFGKKRESKFQFFQQYVNISLTELNNN